MAAQSNSELVEQGRKLLAAPDAEALIKSRERVRAYGEVFTPRYMVETMLDLVKEELEGEDFIDKTFFEPAAGDGNFLVAILHRKLSALQKRGSDDSLPTEALFVLASIYGVELLEDNHALAQSLMLAKVVDFLTKNGVTCTPQTDLYRAAKYIWSGLRIRSSRFKR